MARLSLVASAGLLLLLPTVPLVSAFVESGLVSFCKNTPISGSSPRCQSSLQVHLPDEFDHSVFGGDDTAMFEEGSEMTPIDNDDPASVEIADSTLFEESPLVSEEAALEEYPFALMMQGSAPYIASHAGEIAVFHIPGELLDTKAGDSILSDIALARVLGMKVVLVVGSVFDADQCELDFDNPAECANALTVTNEETLRLLEESAGYLRTEVERKINRCVKLQGGGLVQGSSGFVVSGTFYTAQKYGMVRGQDFEFTGFTSAVNTKSIRTVLNDDDIVLLTTVGSTRMGDLVNVNGYHLAAAVAASLKAYKLVYFANEGSVLCQKGDKSVVQEIPLSFAEKVNSYHGVKVHKAGFATFDNARKKLGPRGVELLLHLGWASWALQEGVNRAHIVNPTDGALLEELFTSKNGANTCVYHDEELEEEEDVFLAEEGWDSYFESLTKKGQRVAKFG